MTLVTAVYYNYNANHTCISSQRNIYVRSVVANRTVAATGLSREPWQFDERLVAMAAGLAGNRAHMYGRHMAGSSNFILLDLNSLDQSRV